MIVDLHTDLRAPVYPQVLPHPPKLPESLREALHVRHYSNRTEDIGHVIHARKPIHLPVVLTHEEVKALLSQLAGDKWLMASLMYGAGLRLMECLRLRVQDIDFFRNEIMVRDGKGAKDRITMLAESLKQPCSDQLKNSLISKPMHSLFRLVSGKWRVSNQ